jgi:hypothetical protein
VQVSATDDSADRLTFVTGIVSVLREGLQEFGVDGWAGLDAVRSWVVEDHPDQTPEKSNCCNWLLVLDESRLVDLK